jgi:glycerol transport system ATP-binding protein
VPTKKAYISFPEQWLKVYVDEYLVDIEEPEDEEKETV